VAESAERVAERIWAAWCSGERLPARPALDGAAAGMAAQDALRAHAGASYGWKIAATTAAGQAHVAVDRPLPGPLFTRFRREPGDVLSSDHLHMRVVEAEFAYRLGADVEPGGDVLAAVAGVHLAVEVPDSRYERFVGAGAAALLADAACAGRFVLGPELPGWRELDLSTATTHLWINGERAASGSGGAPSASFATAALSPSAASGLPALSRVDGGAIFAHLRPSGERRGRSPLPVRGRCRARRRSADRRRR